MLCNNEFSFELLIYNDDKAHKRITSGSNVESGPLLQITHRAVQMAAPRACHTTRVSRHAAGRGVDMSKGGATCVPVAGTCVVRVTPVYSRTSHGRRRRHWTAATPTTLLTSSAAVVGGCHVSHGHQVATSAVISPRGSCETSQELVSSWMNTYSELWSIEGTHNGRTFGPGKFYPINL